MPRVFTRFETRNGDPITTGAGIITPISRALVIRTNKSGPFQGGLVWNRPVGVTVQTGDGQRIFVPLVDVTRVAQIAILLTSFLGVLLIRRVYRHR